MATHLYRIALEAVQCAMKHADARKILISLRREGEGIQLSITDDGAEYSAEPGHKIDVESSIMKYRANMAGGSL